jgi:hypothetical protein
VSHDAARWPRLKGWQTSPPRWLVYAASVHPAERNDFTGIRIEEWAEAALRHPIAAEPRRPEAGHTAHLNAVGGSGMMAALTLTHGPAWFGGRWVIPGIGVIMNGGPRDAGLRGVQLAMTASPRSACGRICLPN